ncbi:hypothetical protein [Paenibacillus illinoisensis]|uniref:hypothetical protein n=1 Tax=Paenibacillus illinoisensis TaxID=59845 RepID=UPI0030165C77
MSSNKARGQEKTERHDSVIQGYIESREKQRQLQKRTLAIVIASQICGGAGLAAGITVGALLAQEMLGTGQPRLA